MSGMIKVDDVLPSCLLWELLPAQDDGIPSLHTIDVGLEMAGKAVVIVGVPGAFTLTCTRQHIPGYLELVAHFQTLGIDDVWCVAVNDAYVMRAWGEQLGTSGKIRMLSDGNAEFVRMIGLERDLSSKGMGVRSQRFSMLVVNGVVKVLNIEPSGKFVVSGAQQLYIQAQGVLDKE